MVRSKQLSGALVLALALSAGCTAVFGRRLTHAGEMRPGTRAYFSTRRPMAPGQVLRASDLQPIAWPANTPVDGALGKTEEIVGRAVLYPLAPGQPVLDRELARPGSGPGLASKIPNGMRAIALKSDEVVGVAGFLEPGSHVDVLSTYRMTQATEPSAATVLQNAEVIAAGQQTEPDPQGKAVSTTVVTLLLDPQQAERALLASSQGSLHFVLRNSADHDVLTEAPVTLSELTGGPKPAQGGMSGVPAALFHPAAAMRPVKTASRKESEGDGVEIILGEEGKGGSSRTAGLDLSKLPGNLGERSPATPALANGPAPALPSSFSTVAAPPGGRP